LSVCTSITFLIINIASGTFKLKKTDLQRQGFDLKLCKGDPVYYWNSSIKGYSSLDAQMQKEIETGVYNRI
uniref:Transposase n=1 Tax=Nippostrongylus brasiliensis TaxID=27835 RepID=A0A0N4YTD1_NIPBR